MREVDLAHCAGGLETSPLFVELFDLREVRLKNFWLFRVSKILA